MVINLFSDRPDQYEDLFNKLKRFDVSTRTISVDMVRNETTAFTPDDLLIADPRALEVSKNILDIYRVNDPDIPFIIAAPRYVQSAMNEIERKWSFLPLRNTAYDPVLEEEVYQAYLREVKDDDSVHIDPETGEIIDFGNEAAGTDGSTGADTGDACSCTENDLMKIIGDLSGIISLMASDEKYGDHITELSERMRSAAGELEMVAMLNGSTSGRLFQ